MGKVLRWLAILAVLGFPLAVVGSRLGFWDFLTGGYTLVRYTLFLSVVVFVAALVAMLIWRQSRPEQFKAARTAVLLTLLPLIGLGTQLAAGSSVPRIHNISTDIADPPEFDKIVELRGAQHNPLEYDAATLGPLQTEAYPEVKTLRVSDDLATAMARAKVVAQSLGWEIVAENPSKGLIEATETTLLWQFKDDVVIRIRSDEEGSTIDLRSVSRVGQSDLGANARRIVEFIDAYRVKN